MKIYVLGKRETDYLEIWEFTTIVGVYSSKAKAKAMAKKLDIEDYSIEEKVLDA